MSEPNTDALREEILQLMHSHHCHSGQMWIKGMTEPFPCDCGAVALLNDYDQARLTAVLAKPELLAYDDELGKGLKWAVPVEAITAAFEAVV